MIAIAVAAILMSSATIGPIVPMPATLAASLAGQWQGTLGYRDYQTSKLYELPVRTEIRALADGVTVLRVSSFDDGPKTGSVYITTASLYAPATATVTDVSLRKGRKVQATTDTVAVAAYTDPTHWSVRYQEDGMDDDKPAKLRVTETRTGDMLLSIKEVLPASATDGIWQFRNQTRLTRVP